ncbi:MAG: hypothetical protein ACTSVU_08575 [Promethearchaeota archaeon]
MQQESNIIKCRTSSAGENIRDYKILEKKYLKYQSYKELIRLFYPDGVNNIFEQNGE